jgi:SAM-dependent methyltransferase
MHVQPYSISPHNAHYNGSYSESALEWRRLGAIDKANNLQALLNDRPVSAVLDVGCGTGSVLSELIRRNIGREHVGVDVSDPHAHRDGSADGLDLRRYDGHALPFADDSFDLVYASHVVEHVPDPRGFLRELDRVSSKFVYVEVPCEATLLSRPSAIQTALRIGHINAYTPDYFMVLLQTAGLNVVDFQVFDHSIGVHSFGKPQWKALIQQAVRRSMLRVAPAFAPKLLCYHAGALIDCKRD